MEVAHGDVTDLRASGGGKSQMTSPSKPLVRSQSTRGQLRTYCRQT